MYNTVHNHKYTPKVLPAHVCSSRSQIQTTIYINACTFAFSEEFSNHLLTWLPICSWPLSLSRHRSLAWHLGGGLYNAIHDLICCIISCIRWIVIASIPWTDTTWKSQANQLRKKTRRASCVTLVLQLAFLRIEAGSSATATSNWPQEKNLPNREYCKIIT